MTNDKAVTTIRVPKSLQGRYDDFPKKYWLNFPDFCREAIREKLTREELRDLREIVEREEPGPLRSSQEKPSS